MRGATSNTSATSSPRILTRVAVLAVGVLLGSLQGCRAGVAPSIENMPTQEPAPTRAPERPNPGPRGFRVKCQVTHRELEAFASYFDSVQTRIRERYVLTTRMMRLIQRTVIFVRPPFTVLRVTLSSEGNLTNFAVVQSADDNRFDEIAIDALEKGQPFQAPPPDLLDSEAQTLSFDITFHAEFGM